MSSELSKILDIIQAKIETAAEAEGAGKAVPEQVLDEQNEADVRASNNPSVSGTKEKKYYGLDFADIGMKRLGELMGIDEDEDYYLFKKTTLKEPSTMSKPAVDEGKAKGDQSDKSEVGKNSKAAATEREMRIEDLNGVYIFTYADREYKEYLLKTMTAIKKMGYLDLMNPHKDSKTTKEDEKDVNSMNELTEINDDEGNIDLLMKQLEEAKITDEDKTGEDVIETEVKEDKINDQNQPEA